MTNKSRARRAQASQSTALVHQTAADLVFKYGVQATLEEMSKVCRTKRRAYRTPEYRADIRDELEGRILTYIEQMPDVGEAAGVELHWEPPTVVEQNGELVMIKWSERDSEAALQQ